MDIDTQVLGLDNLGVTFGNSDGVVSESSTHKYTIDCATCKNTWSFSNTREHSVRECLELATQKGWGVKVAPKSDPLPICPTCVKIQVSLATPLDIEAEYDRMVAVQEQNDRDLMEFRHLIRGRCHHPHISHNVTVAPKSDPSDLGWNVPQDREEWVCLLCSSHIDHGDIPATSSVTTNKRYS